MNILAIETSCDETACAVIKNGITIISNVVATSKDMHETWGGVVPEVAAREQLSSIIPVISEALKPFIKQSEKLSNTNTKIYQIIRNHIDSLAVTVGPGLIGSLLVGVETAKTIAYACNKPVIPVNHVLAHIYANFIDSNNKEIRNSKFEIRNSNLSVISYPAIALVVSGGHTELYLMKSIKDLLWLGGTIDDAAGECFDKSARIIGLGHGGGSAIEQCASQFITHHSSLITHNSFLPRPMMHDESLNFSFSGLKTAVSREWNKINSNLGFRPACRRGRISNFQPFFAHEIQEAITDVLVAKTLRAAEKYDVKSILIAGGVASNFRLREKFNSHLSSHYSQLTTNNLQFFSPSPSLCTDNAAAIGSYAFFRGKPKHWKQIEVMPDMNVESIE